VWVIKAVSFLLPGCRKVIYCVKKTGRLTDVLLLLLYLCKTFIEGAFATKLVDFVAEQCNV